MILIFIDNIDRANFFKRLILGGDKRVFKVITLKYSVYSFMSRFVDVELVKLPKLGTSEDGFLYPKKSILDNLTHVFRKTQSVTRAKKIYYCVTQALLNMKDITEINYGVVHNGNSAGALAFTDFLKMKGNSILFTEISNLPGKVIFDPKGVNARSSIYENSHILDALTKISEKEHLAWLQRYEEYKKTPIPQSKNKLSFILSYMVDRLYGTLISGIVEEDISWYDKYLKFQENIQSKRVLTKNEYKKLKPESYLFFPTQVKNDSQLIINSDYDNLTALNFAIDLAKKRDLKLVVKVHPAETDIGLIKTYYDMMDINNFIIVSNNTTDLIKNSAVIITINSTVGLEALIYNKELITLGRAIYKEFDYEKVKIFIHHYLINFDYFSDEIISPIEFKKIELLLNK